MLFAARAAPLTAYAVAASVCVPNAGVVHPLIGAIGVDALKE